jgi:hypothetical protein
MENHPEEKLENCWAVCYASPDQPSSIGYVVSEKHYFQLLGIKDSEKGHTRPTYWDPKKVERFPTIQKTIERYIEKRSGTKETFESVLEHLAKDFPSHFAHVPAWSKSPKTIVPKPTNP